MNESRNIDNLQIPIFYRRELDCLRFFAFLSVFIHHVCPQLESQYIYMGFSPTMATLLSSFVISGGLGVDLFFVLSSYLITEILIRENETRGEIRLAPFYIRRLLRIWPLYFAFIILLSFFPHYSLKSPHIYYFLFFLGNWAVVKYNYPPSPAAPLWSVSIEEQFYIVWPLMLKWVGIYRLKLCCVILIIFAFFIRILLYLNNAHHPAVWTNTLARLDPIAFGALISVGLRRNIPKYSMKVRIFLIGSGLFALILSVHFLSFDGFGSIFLYPISALGCVSILLGALGIDTGDSLIARLFAYLGRISYGLYVFHMLAIMIVNYLTVSLFNMILGSFTLTILFAMASYHLLESPFLGLKKNFTFIRTALR